MKKVTQFDKQNVSEVRAYLEAKFHEIKMESGLILDFKNITFSAEKFSTTLTVYAAASDESTPVNVDKVEWDANCYRFNLKPEQFGKTIKYQGKEWEIVGLKKYAENYPILGLNLADGKTYKLPRNFVQFIID